MLTLREILDDIPDLYVLKWWPKDDFEDIKGFTMKSSEEEFADALKEVTHIIGKKGYKFKVETIQFKVKQADLRKKEITIVTDDKLFGEGELEMKWWITRKGATVEVKRKKGSEASHLKQILRVVKFLLDGTLDKAFTKSMIDSFTLNSGPKSKDECSKCGYSYKTRVGETLHKCDVVKYGIKCSTCGEMFTSQENLEIHIEKVHKKEEAEPMHVSSDASENADQLLSSLLDHVVESRPFVKLTEHAKETLPGKKNDDINVRQYLCRKLPGASIKQVSADGACVLRALSLIVFGTESHYRTIGRLTLLSHTVI